MEIEFSIGKILDCTFESLAWNMEQYLLVHEENVLGLSYAIEHYEKWLRGAYSFGLFWKFCEKIISFVTDFSIWHIIIWYFYNIMVCLWCCCCCGERESESLNFWWMHFRAAGLTPLKKLGKVLGGKAHIFCAIKYFFGYIYWKCPMNYLKVKSVPIYIFIIVYTLLYNKFWYSTGSPRILLFCNSKTIFK